MDMNDLFNPAEDDKRARKVKLKPHGEDWIVTSCLNAPLFPPNYVIQGKYLQAIVKRYVFIDFEIVAE